MTELRKKRILSGWYDLRSPEEERRLLLLCLAAAFCWGLAAHAYGFFRASFSHDMLNALVVTDVETYWKMQLGRPGIVLYRRIFRGTIAAPWLLGLISLFWLGLSVYLTTKLFRIPGRLFPILTAGILTVNLSVTAMTASYLYEMDADLFAMLLGIGGVFLWDRCGRSGAALGTFLIACCMSIYQSMLSVPITLVMLLSMTALLRGEKFADVFRKGLRGLLMLLLGAAACWLAVRLMCTLKQINLTPDSYNSVDGQGERRLLSGFLKAYQTWANSFWNPRAAHIEAPVLILNILLPPAASLRLLAGGGKNLAGKAERLLFLALLLLLPLGMNTAQILFSQDVHELMQMAFWLFYLLCLLPFFVVPPKTAWQRTVAALLAVLLLCPGIQTANIIYTKKDLEQEACSSLMTRVLGRLEEQPDYHPGRTPLVFVGISEQLQRHLYGFGGYYDLNGCESSNPLVKSDVSYYYNTYGAWLRYILNNPAVMAGPADWTRLQTDPRVKAMPPYPADGCMLLVDGIYVIKMGD